MLLDRFEGQRLFGKSADLIITSNGGVIPIEFENCYPYLTYDAHGEKKYDAPYIAKMIVRLEAFLRRFPYRFCLFHYRHNLRNVVAVTAVGRKLKAEGVIEDFAVLPVRQHYEQAQQEKFFKRGFAMYPELWPCMLDPVVAKFREFERRARE